MSGLTFPGEQLATRRRPRTTSHSGRTTGRTSIAQSGGTRASSDPFRAWRVPLGKEETTMRLAPALAAAFVAFASSPALAREAPPGAGPYTLELVGESGRSLPAFEHRGQAWVLGRRDQRYLLRVRNGSGRRIEVVASVDGRDVVTGARPPTRSAATSSTPGRRSSSTGSASPRTPSPPSASRACATPTPRARATPGTSA